MNEPTIRHRAIYQDVYDKRSDPRHTSRSADGIARAHLSNGSLQFDGGSAAFSTALTEGIFFLQIPEWIDITVGDDCAQNFFRGPAHPPYGALRDLTSSYFDDTLLGFHERSNQIEQFLLESRFWHSSYPSEVAHLGSDLTTVSRQVIRSVLEHVDIPNCDWERATGGCSKADGSYHLTFNHYRPTVDEVGLSSHKDDGFVTLLRATDPGLEINRHNQWETLQPLPGHLIVNFGLSMQLLTSRCNTPIAAIMHRVTRQEHDRTTFGHFSSSRCTNDADAGIYRYVPGDGLHRICGSRELIDLNDYEIYEGTDVPSGVQE